MAFGDFTVTRASTKLRIGSNGLYGSVANNVPAFEFNTDGSYRGLLVEPGAVNIQTHSQDFTNGIYAKVGSTVTGNVTASPDGATTADKLIADATNAQHRLDTTSTATNAVHTFSVYAKASEYGFIQLRMTVGGSTGSGAWFNLTNGTVGTTTIVTARIDNFGNGWYRCSVTGTADLNAVCRINLGTADNTGTFMGDGTSGAFLWQAQLETGSVATSPIVTTAGTANRAADVVSLTGASSLIGQQEGWVFAECAFRSTSTDATATPSGFVLGNTATSARGIAFGVGAANAILTESRNDSGQTTSTIVASYTLGQRFKIALYYNFSNQAVNTTVTNGLKVFYNGTLQGTYDLRVPPSASFLDNVAFQGRIRGTSPTTPSDSKHALSFAIGIGTLSDAQGIALTTL
jgi:alpha-D-ribose 1-methylphosphonate 5-triphosphate synthase subunit PhnG